MVVVWCAVLSQHLPVGFRKLRNTSPEDGSRCHPKGSVCFLIMVTAEKVFVSVGDVAHVTQDSGL